MNVFILESRKDNSDAKEYRVDIFEFFGDIDYEEKTDASISERQLKNARKFFKDSKVFQEFEDAIDYAEYLRTEYSDTHPGKYPFVSVIVVNDLF